MEAGHLTMIYAIAWNPMAFMGRGENHCKKGGGITSSCNHIRTNGFGYVVGLYPVFFYGWDMFFRAA